MNSTLPSIESARPADVPTIRALIYELAQFERLAHQAQATQEQIHEALFGAAPSAEVILARLDGTTAGFALFFHSFSTFAGRRGLYLEDLFVRPQFRGMGCGKALLAYLARMAVARGCARMEWSVLDWNRRAIGFYESLGAIPMDEWTTYRLTGEALARLGSD